MYLYKLNDFAINTPVQGIFAKEVNQGIVFSSEKNDKNQDIINNEQNNTVPDSVTYPQKNKTKPNLRIVK